MECDHVYKVFPKSWAKPHWDIGMCTLENCVSLLNHYLCVQCPAGNFVNSIYVSLNIIVFVYQLYFEQKCANTHLHDVQEAVCLSV
jgi:hypothetical protein